jgi:uncharacterized protein YciI
MQFIHMLHLTEMYRTQENWNETADKTIEEHFNFLKNLYDSGAIKYVGKTDLEINDIHNTGIVILEADSLPTAKELVSKDPAVISGIMSFEIFPFHTVMPWKN